ncbi:MAG: 8-oxo-dGTP diphosphatase [Candidatus Paceibacterota bacterium]
MSKNQTQFTLGIVYRHPHVLLGMKKRGFGEGRFNGFGGKLEAGESVEDAARRELKEEAGIDALEVEKLGRIAYWVRGQHDPIHMHVFLVDEYAGEPVETEEMRPQWFHIDELPFENMWESDRHWLPVALERVPFSGWFIYDEDDKLKKFDLERLEY